MDRGIGDLDRFKSLLAQHVGGTRSDDFRRALDEAPLWEATLAWNRFATHWNQTPILSLNPDAATSRAAEAAAHLEKWGDHPQADALNKHLLYLGAIQQRKDESGQSTMRPLNELFNNPSIAELWMVEHRNGKKYYVPNDRSLQETRTFRYIKDFDLSISEKPVTVRLEDVVGDKAEAPQSQRAKEALYLLARMSDGEWEAVFADILAAVWSDKLLDPIVKIILLKAVMETGIKGSRILATELARPHEILRNSELDLTVNWLDPDDKDAQRVRRLAKNLVGRLPDLDLAVENILVEAARLAESKLPVYEWIGWLDQEKNRRWRCRTNNENVQLSGTLFVVRKDPSAGIRYEKIGTVTEGEFKVKAFGGSGFLRGRPVYLQTTQ